MRDVAIRGRGILYLSDFEKTTYYRAVEISFSQNIAIEGIIANDPPHDTVLIGQSSQISIRNIKTFSTRFENVTFNGVCDHPSVIEGFDESRVVDEVTFRQLRINGRHVLSPEAGNIRIGNHAHHIEFN